MHPHRSVPLARTFAALPLTLAAMAGPSAIAGAETVDPRTACPGATDLVRFVDVESDAPHAEAVGCAGWWEVMLGDSRGRFTPGATTRRDQMASVVARLVDRLGGSLPGYAPDPYRDVDPASPHAGAIARITAAGIAQGTGDRNFDPDGTVTRAQMATFLVRAYEYARGAALPTGADSFGDDDGSVHEAAIDKAAAAGFAEGATDGIFAPRAPVRRDQSATFTVRALGRAVQSGFTQVPVEHAAFEGSGPATSAPFRLRGGIYTAGWEYFGDCYYGPTLEPVDPEADRVVLPAGIGPPSPTGPVRGQADLGLLEARGYRLKVQTGGNEPCAWRVRLDRTG